MTLHSYSKPLNLGHKYLVDFFAPGHSVVVQEKVDGSQFSFGIVDDVLLCRSRKQVIDFNNPGMFAEGIARVKRLHKEGKLTPGYTYRGEYLQKPKHNTLKYARVPEGHIILFDVDCGDNNYMSPDDLLKEGERLGLEVVPHIADIEGQPTEEQLARWLQSESVLGGCPIEGVVFKRYDLFDPDGKVRMAKYVSADFREMHGSTTSKVRSSRAQAIVDGYNKEARWKKAVQHLQENGQLEGTPKDIGDLMREIAVDFEAECKEEVMELLWDLLRKDIIKGIQQGFPDWYKQEIGIV